MYRNIVVKQTTAKYDERLSFCIVTQALCRGRGGAALVLVQLQLGHDTINCIVTRARAGCWENCVTIQSLYRDKRAAWSWACHDTIDCIVTGEKKVWPLAVSGYRTTRAAIRRRDRVGARIRARGDTAA